MRYSHTQHAPLHYFLLAVSTAMLIAALSAHAAAFVYYVLLCAAAMVFLFALSFQWLKVEDAGDRLSIRYGWLPLFGKQIRYEEMTAVERGKTSLIDGWGIHWVPGRGWTYNLWGFDCVRLAVGERTIRVGSDDAANLAAFLKTKIGTDRDG